MKNNILKLRKNLYELNYSNTIMSLLSGDITTIFFPKPNYKFASRKVELLNMIKQPIFKFFLLGEKIKEQDILIFLDKDVVYFLKEENIIIKEAEYLKLNDFILIPYYNNYFFIANPFLETASNLLNTPYFGYDSLILAKQIQNYAYGNVLDLCCGCGIQGILAAKNSNFVEMIDVDEKALKIAKINAILNKVDSKVSIRRVNILNEYENFGLYDFIISNPPFIPINDESNYPITGAGGEDGLLFIKLFLNKFINNLEKNGQLIISAQALGTKDKLSFSYLLENINFSYDLLILEKYSLNGFLEELKKFTDFHNLEASETWINKLQEIYDSYYTFVLYLKKNEMRDYNIQKMYEKFSIDENFYIESVVYDKIDQLYKIYIDDYSSIIVDNQIIKILKFIDGPTNLRDIFKKHNIISENLKDRLSNIFEQLYKFKIIRKVNNNE